MIAITTRRHPLKFYAHMIFYFVLLFALGLILMLASIDIYKNGQKETIEYFIPPLSIAFYLLSLRIVYAYWKNAPKVTIGDNIVKIGNQTYYFKDIKKITLTGKRYCRFIFSYPMESLVIQFKDGTEKVLIDDMYSNISEVKLFLEQVDLKKQEYKALLTNNLNRNDIQIENEETYKGYQLLSFTGIVLWGIIVTLLHFVFRNLETLSIDSLFASIVMIIFLFTAFSWQLFYFGLTKDILIVKNHNFFWMTRYYRLVDIKEVIFEQYGRQPNGMRVITKDFKTKLYLAATLRNKTWLELQRNLLAKGIKVRNESVPGT